ncbi:MAG: hypothetical protein ACI9Y1_001880 [Lentisphaeria bacterium]
MTLADIIRYDVSYLSFVAITGHLKELHATEFSVFFGAANVGGCFMYWLPILFACLVDR